MATTERGRVRVLYRERICTWLVLLLPIGWAFGVLVGATAALTFFGSSLGTPLGLWLADRFSGGRHTRTHLALRLHTDPGPDLHPDVLRRARSVVEDGRLLTGILLAVQGVVALTCIVVAVLRSDGLVALPVLALAPAACWVVIVARRSRARAQRWLDAFGRGS